MNHSIDPGFNWLSRHAINVTSQYGEDGVIDAIFSRIWPSNKWCFECGAADGIFFSNTRRLLKLGWDAILVEADHDAYRRLVANSAEFGDRARTYCEKLQKIDPILAQFRAPTDIDLVVLDTDNADIHLFNSMLHFKPRVVMIEFDAAADEDFIPDLGGPGQASATATARMAKGRLYTEVWRSWCNQVFVREPLSQMLLAHPE